ncbi:MAG TPA: TIGR03619 family F420-dependent LLM class oxidoreductase [Acidimicrobiales bacterium]|nr:TIGR03619 family F420-dependent LLM class oxidoreductase [Acidimicrobiales bacterium]
MAAQSLTFGVALPQWGRWADPGFLRQYAAEAERCGFEGVWGVDHLVMPRRIDSLYPLGTEPAAVEADGVASVLAPNYEMVATLTWVASCTSRVALGTAICVLPLRNTVVTARQIATVDAFSGGRVRFGVGVGWMAEEGASVGVPWSDRGKRMDEQIELLRALWGTGEDTFEFHGRFHDVVPMDPAPRPTQRPIPILVGGHSGPALDRAGRLGDGWIAAPMAPDRFATLARRVLDSAERHGRDPGALLLCCSASLGPEHQLHDVSSAGTAELADLVGRYRDAGVHHLQVDLRAGSPAASLEALQRFAEEVAPAVS